MIAHSPVLVLFSAIIKELNLLVEDKVFNVDLNVTEIAEEAFRKGVIHDILQRFKFIAFLRNITIYFLPLQHACYLFIQRQ